MNGTLVSSNSTSVTVAHVEEKNYPVGRLASVTLNGKEVKLTELMKGDELVFSDGSTITFLTASRKVSKVIALDKNNVTIQRNEGRDPNVTYRLSDTVGVTLNSEVVKLSDLKIGDEISFEGDPIHKISITREQSLSHNYEGTFVGVTNNTLNVSHVGKDNTSNLIAVNPIITLNGKPSKLDELKPGDKLSYIADPNVTSIVATR